MGRNQGNQGSNLSQEDRRRGGETSAKEQKRNAQGQFAGMSGGRSSGGKSGGGSRSGGGNSSGGSRGGGNQGGGNR
jgi:hypothetical protein